MLPFRDIGVPYRETNNSNELCQAEVLHCTHRIHTYMITDVNAHGSTLTGYSPSSTTVIIDLLAVWKHTSIHMRYILPCCYLK